MPTVSAPVLTGFVESILTAAGVAARKASITAACLVDANLRGVDSHGILLLPRYIERMQAGDIDIHAEGRVLSESGACLHFDAQNGIGQWASEQCCAHATRIASALGIGMAVARDSNHFGAAAFWGKKLAAAGHIGIVMCNASPLVPPWQGKQGMRRHEPHLHGAPRTVAARYGDHHGRGQPHLQGAGERT